MHSATIKESKENASLSNTLLTCGMVAGPLFTVVGLAQAFTRPGYDITRHTLSLLSNGDLGWIQVANFIVTGILIIAGAAGIRQALRGSRGGTWGPLLIAINGLGFIGAGIFKPDPALGFPPGTPLEGNAFTTTGLLHFVFGGLGFLAMIVSCFVFARRFAGLNERGWAWFSLATGVLFLVGFFGISSGARHALINVGFFLSITLSWVWLTALCARIKAEHAS